MTKYKELYFYGTSIDYSYTLVGGFREEKDIENYNKLYDKFKNNKLKDKGYIHVTPFSRFPLYKLKNYIKENNLDLKFIRNYTQQYTTLLIDNTFIQDFYKINYPPKTYYIVPYQYIMSTFTKYIKGPNPHSKQPPLDMFIIKDETVNTMIKYSDEFSSLLNFESITCDLLFDYHGNKIATQNINLYKQLFDLVQKYELDIVFDETLNNEINKETVIDLEMFQTLHNMLSSTDVSNHSIAQELIANSNFESSKPYILFLANMFKILRNKSNNKNYIAIHSQLKQYKSLFSYEPLNFFNFIELITKKHPEYKQTICNCLTIHLNHVFKNDIIKEIQSF